MQRLCFSKWVGAGLAILALGFLAGPTLAELKPGDILSKENCNEAKGLLPDRMQQGFCNGCLLYTSPSPRD